MTVQGTLLRQKKTAAGLKVPSDKKFVEQMNNY
jgi:hypothetical protein